VNVIEKLLTINQYSRSGRKLAACKGIIFHYVGIANQKALKTWDYFEKIALPTSTIQAPITLLT